MGCSGYYFGHAIEYFLSGIKPYEKWVILGLMASGMVVWIIHKWREKKEFRKERKKSEPRNIEY